MHMQAHVRKLTPTFESELHRVQISMHSKKM